MSDVPKAFHLTPQVQRYVVDHSTALDDVQRALIAETEALGFISIMQIAPEQGAFMEQFARAMGATRAIEVGTFTGYSALCLARGLGPGGRLLCCDIDESWTAVGRRYWQRAGVADRIDLRIAPAADTLAALPEDPVYDLAFIDADKTGYRRYYEEILTRLRPNGVVFVDNVLWMGTVVDPESSGEDIDAIRAFNDFVVADPRVEVAMLTVGDGLSLIRKKQ
ncbi:MAG: class I SAM-dependent methyltransferase [Deltaproteobacteria bacterium]|nr:class I SAM-dependent methyltransferase [Deltaproteobacteria bacterium]